MSLGDSKYIVVEDEFGNEVAVLFSPTIQHWIAAKPYRDRVLSAGFYAVRKGKVEVFGESLSLKLKTREIDAHYIARLLGIQQP